MQFVVFSLNNQLYSLSVKEVVEILRVPKITNVPGIPHLIKGVINLRGSIITIINLHERFQLPQPESDKKNRVFIVQGDNENIGFIVDEVKMVTKFDVEETEPPFGIKIDKDLFVGFAKLDGEVIGILNIEKVLYNEHLAG
ncbi:purine-binding chemotaxis protein CheW [Lysinibacillus antri]|uniref:Purine-binding chemotaxis protein CheW n=2 Tax=Bacillaceae TaxID=186817 RepID=A0A432L7M2_9BACI|nr:purine-binding chemotaxis protein CheW [Lysinibacillus antri]TSI10775.1 purine-binding chemotaxis protein CheW [Lysinibacillus sp. BW-2-10]